MRTLVIRDRSLKQNKNRLAVAKSALSHKITLKPSKTIDVKGYVDSKIDHKPTAAILQEPDHTSIPDFIDVTPSVVHYDFKKTAEVTVSLSNLYTNTMSISPKSVF